MHDYDLNINYLTSDTLFEQNNVQRESNNDSPKAFYLLGETYTIILNQ